MYEEIEAEFQAFLSDMVNDSSLCFKKYFDTWNYEDEYSHNSIHEAQGLLYSKIFEWLKRNKPNKFLLFFNENVCVASVDYAKNHMITNYNEKIVR